MRPVRDPKDGGVGRKGVGKRVAGEAVSSALDAGQPGAPGAPTHEGESALDEDFESLPKRERHGGRRSEAVRRRVDRLRAPDGARAVESPEAIPTEQASVVATQRGRCEVELPSGEFAVAHLPKALAQSQQSDVAVGDRVLLERRPSGELAVANLLPRSSRLSRPDPFYAHRERVIAANLDLAVVVTSIRRPPLAIGLLDRFLVALAHGGVAAAIAVNKIDLADARRDRDPELVELEPYRSLGMPLVACSTKTGEGLEELRALLAGRTVVFVGHSGVGKSSLLNALAPEFAAEVGEVSEAHARGRHTTTRARVYRLPEGTRIIDTPGIREFGLWKMTARELATYFDEFLAVAADCRFADCTHTHEPKCAVRSAGERGDLPRYATYLRILASLGEP